MRLTKRTHRQVWPWYGCHGTEVLRLALALAESETHCHHRGLEQCHYEDIPCRMIYGGTKLYSIFIAWNQNKLGVLQKCFWRYFSHIGLSLLKREEILKSSVWVLLPCLAHGYMTKLSFPLKFISFELYFHFLIHLSSPFFLNNTVQELPQTKLALDQNNFFSKRSVVPTTLGNADLGRPELLKR